MKGTTTQSMITHLNVILKSIICIASSYHSWRCEKECPCLLMCWIEAFFLVVLFAVVLAPPQIIITTMTLNLARMNANWLFASTFSEINVIVVLVFVQVELVCGGEKRYWWCTTPAAAKRSKERNTSAGVSTLDKNKHTMKQTMHTYVSSPELAAASVLCLLTLL